MKTTKPKLRRVYLTIMDGVTRKSKTITFYDTTVDEVLSLQKTLPDRRPRRQLKND